MPYVIVEVKGGYKVRKRDRDPKTGRFRYFSNHPLTRQQAEKQMIALRISESRS